MYLIFVSLIKYRVSQISLWVYIFLMLVQKHDNAILIILFRKPGINKKQKTVYTACENYLNQVYRNGKGFEVFFNFNPYSLPTSLSYGCEYKLILK